MRTNYKMFLWHCDKQSDELTDKHSISKHIYTIMSPFHAGAPSASSQHPAFLSDKRHILIRQLTIPESMWEVGPSKTNKRVLLCGK